MEDKITGMWWKFPLIIVFTAFATSLGNASSVWWWKIGPSLTIALLFGCWLGNHRYVYYSTYVRRVPPLALAYGGVCWGLHQLLGETHPWALLIGIGNCLVIVLISLWRSSYQEEIPPLQRE